MPATEMIVMIAAFSAMILALIHVLRLIGTFIVHRTLRKAIEVDPASAGPLLETLESPREQRGDDRLSVLLIAFGIAMVAASLVIGDPTWMHYGVAAALFPLIVGSALALRFYIINRNRAGVSAA
jgi:uncharacterized membrane protein